MGNGYSEAEMDKQTPYQVIEPNGDIHYYINVKWHYNGKIYHRINGPAVITRFGDKIWYRYGKEHREGGPSTESADGMQKWLIHGKLHREDGPAIITPNGEHYWFLEGVEIKAELLEKLPSTEEQMMALLPDRFKYYVIVNKRRVLLDHWFKSNAKWFYNKYRLLF